MSSSSSNASSEPLWPAYGFQRFHLRNEGWNLGISRQHWDCSRRFHGFTRFHKMPKTRASRPEPTAMRARVMGCSRKSLLHGV